MFAKESLPASHYDVTARLNGEYDSLLAAGQYHAFTYPFGALGAAVVIAYLLLDHRSRPWLRRTRFLAWGFICAFAIWSIKTFRARNPAASFGVGLISGWSCLWCAVMLVFGDAQSDFHRIEKKERWLDGTSELSSTPGSDGEANGSLQANGELRKRTTNKTAKNQNGSANGKPKSSEVGSSQTPTQRQGTYAWQSYPSSPFFERLDWVLDVFSNFRGMGWNWRISGLPEPPMLVQSQLVANNNDSISEKSTVVSHTGIRRFHEKGPLLKANALLLCRNIVILDILKTLVSHDPYFWDGTTSALPGYLPASLQDFPVIIRSSRLLISLCAIYIALQAIFAMGPLFFVGILGPRYLGPRGEPWMYPDSFGSFSNILDKGLAGWWGGWWHQTFRHAFESPAQNLIHALDLDPHSSAAKFIQLTIAFVLSGLLHACGSFTQIGNTHPITGPFTFFILQIAGITAQLLCISLLHRFNIQKRCPNWLNQSTNFLYVHVWFYYTAPLLCDDFARGGIWLFEPLPFSPLRGLGLGAKGDGFWCWWGGIFWWHNGIHWWDTGIAL